MAEEKKPKSVREYYRGDQGPPKGIKAFLPKLQEALTGTCGEQCAIAAYERLGNEFREFGSYEYASKILEILTDERDHYAKISKMIEDVKADPPEGEFPPIAAGPPELAIRDVLQAQVPLILHCQVLLRSLREGGYTYQPLVVEQILSEERSHERALRAMLAEIREGKR